MQDQGKRLLLAVGLMLGVLLMWNAIFSPKNANQKAKQAQPTQPTPTSVAAVQPTSLVGTAPTPPGTAKTPETPIVLKFPKFVATFSNHGGVLESWQLTDPRYKRDETKGQLLAPEGAFALGFTKDSTYQLPAEQDQLWTGKQLSDHEVEYTYSTPQLELVKDYVVVPDSYVVKLKLTVTVKDPGAKDVRESVALTSWQIQDPKKAKGGSSRIMARAWESSSLSPAGLRQTPVASLIEKGPRYEKNIQWSGFEHPYMLVGFAPAPVTGASVDKYSFADPKGLMRTDMVWTPQSVFNAKSSSPLTRDVVAYLGPKDYDQLNHADKVAGFPTGFNQTVDFGWFGFIGKWLLWLLVVFHKVVGNWGVAIIMLTIVVKIATLYWTTKSMRSMKAMAVLGPQMKALQEKYKDDKQKLQVETMAMYKAHGVNPLAGCLPMLLQMPIWWALYRMLEYAGELYQQPFIRGWIDDLTNTDKTYVLPILLVVTMFAQARLTPSTVDPSQKMQQRLMQYGMPIVFGAMSFVFPSGLTLYILVNTCLSAVHSIYMNKYDKKMIELADQMKKSKEAAAAAKDASAAKAAKDANVKDASAKDGTKDAAKPGAAEQLVPQQRPRPNQQRRKKSGRR